MRDQIREHSPSAINKAIDQQTLELLEQYEDASAEDIHERLDELDASVDLESYVQMIGAGLTLAGIVVASRYRRLWFLPALTTGLALSHSLPRWDLVTPFFRLFGLWSRKEIEREKFALKMLRGDFDRLQSDRSPKSALAAAQGSVGLKNGGPMNNEKRRAGPAPAALASESAFPEEPGTTHKMPLGAAFGGSLKPDGGDVRH